MIYTCSSCGASFSPKQLNVAIENKLSIITCNYCNTVTNLIDVRSTSHVAKGYDFLADAKFFDAQNRFNDAINSAFRNGFASSPDAYIGSALAEFQVQTIFDDENRMDPPRLICHRYNDSYFADSSGYISAINAIPNDENFLAERKRIEQFANIIDGIKVHYDLLKSKGEKYGLFVAYEDEPSDIFSDKGYDNANVVGNWFPRNIYNVYLPTPPDIFDDEEDGGMEEKKIKYEAEILYAIDHTKCMTVITDDSIDSRLRSIYSRYYARNNADGLAFIRYAGHGIITLPNGEIAKNVFTIDDKSQVQNFVARRNGRLAEGKIIDAGSKESEKETRENVVIATDNSEYENSTSTFLPVREGDSVVFGVYPQREDKCSGVVDYFDSFIKPTHADNAGWNVMFTNRRGRAFTWYRDDVYNGKKYRAVFYSLLRKNFSLQNTNVDGAQRINRYEHTEKIYCFEFQPIRWSIVRENRDWATLIAQVGLDSREFNDRALLSDWDSATLYDWLNGEFLETAFNEEQSGWLCGKADYDESARVFIPDRKEDSAFFMSDRSVMGITDYFKCIGGGLAPDGGLKSFWITDSDNDIEDEAKVIDPGLRCIATQYVDCTSVAVVPKIYIRLQ